MIAAFFESIRYVGLLFPVAFLRIFVGYQYFGTALNKAQGDYLVQPRLAAEISEWLPQSSAPLWYKSLISEYAIEQWQVLAYTITYCEFLIGVSFILGFFVRPVSMLGIFLSINFIYNSSPVAADMHQAYLTIFITMLWLGAGRCIGLDYFFFKRQRGIWW